MALVERFHLDAIEEGVDSVSFQQIDGHLVPSNDCYTARPTPALCIEPNSANFTAHLLHVLGSNAFDLWFGPQTRIHVGDKVVVVEAETDFLVDCIQQFCQPDLNNAVRQYFGKDYSVRLNITSMNDCGLHKQPEPQLASTVSMVSPVVKAISCKAIDSEPMLLPLVPASSPMVQRIAPPEPGLLEARQGFVKPQKEGSKNVELPFAIGRSNKLAATAVDMVVDRPGELGLLFVYGPNGVGKTHLCKAVRERLRNRHGMRRVIYMRAEQFAIDFSESTRGAGFTAFRKKYRDVEGLIIDDAHFLLGKQGTLAELRNTVDDLLGRRRQLVFTADRPLSELVGMGGDLHARLSGGVSCSLEPLDKDLRRSILASICELHGVRLHRETLDELAERSSGDGRMLYGVAFRLLTQQRISGGHLDHDQALGCLNELFQASQPVLRLADIERVVCNSFGFEPKVLRDKGRSKNVTAARMLAMFLARKLTPSAYSEIGQYFGNRQHSTVISAQKRVENWLSSDEKLNHRGGAVSIREWVRNAETSLRLG